MTDDVVEEHIEDARKAFISGYRSEKNFSEEQEASLPLMRRFVQLQSYGTILHVLSEEVSESPNGWRRSLKN